MKQIFLWVGLLLLAACTSTTEKNQQTLSSQSDNALTDKDKEYFQNVTVNAGQTFTKGDHTAWVDRYSSDALVMVPHMESLKGKEAIKEFGLSYPPVHIELSLVEILGTSNYANARGTYLINDTTGKFLDKGKFLNVWQKDSTGKWEMTHDIWNSDVPLPAEKK